MTMLQNFITNRNACALVAAFVIGSGQPAYAIVFKLNASNIAFDTPSPLFTSNQVGGTLRVSNSVAPGMGFNLSQIQDFLFDFGGIVVTLADAQIPGGAFGTIAADGASLSFLDLRFDLPQTFMPCSFVCAGQIEIGTFDNSNFVAVDDFNSDTLSLVQFDSALTAIPESGTLCVFGIGLAGMIMLRRRRNSEGSPAVWRFC